MKFTMLHLEDLESVVELEPENADARHKLAEILRLGYLAVGIDDDTLDGSEILLTTSNPGMVQKTIKNPAHNVRLLMF